MREGHEIESEIAASFDLGLFLMSKVRTGPRDRKRGWNVQKWRSDFFFYVMNRHDVAHEECVPAVTRVIKNSPLLREVRC